MKRFNLIFAGLAIFVAACAFALGRNAEEGENPPIIKTATAPNSQGKAGLDVENIVNEVFGKDEISNSAAQAMLLFVKSAPEHGLPTIDTARFDAIKADEKRYSKEDKIELTTKTIELAKDLNGGRMNWANARNDWDLRPIARNFNQEFAVAKEQHKITEWLLTLSHDSDAYKALLNARKKYVQIVENGGFTHIGANAQNAQLIRNRLSQEGYAAQNLAAPNIFDAALKAQISLFQIAHGLNPNGELSENTLEAMDVSAKDRLAQIDLNLERERWAPKGNPQTRIEANIPSQYLVYFENGEPKLEMNTIVGATKTKTPMFATKTRAVVLNPPWNVPASIRRRVRRQPPGPNNALGRVKFDFDNKFSVFLHDTPNHVPFAAQNRALSHGCVRLDKPKDLAQILLAPEGLSRENIDKITTTRRTHYYKLKTQTPVLLLYRTAYVVKDRSNREMVYFAKDVYEWDKLLANMLQNNILQNSGNTNQTSLRRFQDSNNTTIAASP